MINKEAEAYSYLEIPLVQQNDVATGLKAIHNTVPTFNHAGNINEESSV